MGRRSESQKYIFALVVALLAAPPLLFITGITMGINHSVAFTVSVLVFLVLLIYLSSYTVRAYSRSVQRRSIKIRKIN